MLTKNYALPKLKLSLQKNYALPIKPTGRQLNYAYKKIMLYQN